MKHFIFGLLASFICIAANAQENPMRGQIFTNENDTIYGMLDFRTNAINANKCTFKADNSTEYKVYKPNEIAGFRFIDNGKYYVSRHFVGRHACFAEYIVKGKLSLYRVEEDLKKTFYFEDENGSVLPYPEDVAFPFDSSYDNAERLEAMVSSSEAALLDLDPGHMSEEKMIRLAEDYNNEKCNAACITYEYDKASDKKDKSVSVFAGVGKGWWNVTDKDYEVDNSNIFIIGASLDIDYRRMMRNMLMQYSLIYTHQNADGRDDLKLNTVSLGFGPMFRFGKDTHSSMFTLRAGWMPTAIWEDYTCLKEKHHWNDTPTPSDLIPTEDRKFTADFFDFYAGFGAEFPIGKLSLLMNIDYRSYYTFQVHCITGTIGMRF